MAELFILGGAVLAGVLSNVERRDGGTDSSAMSESVTGYRTVTPVSESEQQSIVDEIKESLKSAGASIKSALTGEESAPRSATPTPRSASASQSASASASQSASASVRPQASIRSATPASLSSVRPLRSSTPQTVVPSLRMSQSVRPVSVSASTSAARSMEAYNSQQRDLDGSLEMM